MIDSVNKDRLRSLAAQVDAVATAVYGVSVDCNPTERQMVGMWRILLDIAEELDNMSR